MQRTRHTFDLEGLIKRSTSGICFICEFLKGNPTYKHHVVAETDGAIAFLARYPTLYGYVIVVPKHHVDQVTGDFEENAYLELQSLIYRVSEGIRALLTPERMYILSLGSQAANSHVHWHVAALPHGVPLEHQQYYALMHENGVIETTPEEMAELAQNLRSAIGAFGPGA